MTERHHPAPSPGASSSPRIELSVIVPVLDEQDNLRALDARIRSALAPLGRHHEVIYVDDGSRDGSLAVLRELVAGHPELRVLALRRNFGQTAALAAGFEAARGELIVPLDADLQNDPADIPRLLARLEEGYDVASGWRRERHDPWVRTLPSRLANRLISAVTGVAIHDFGCTLKAYRREVVVGLPLYGEMHRFIPALASWQGARVTEVEVSHAPRRAGRSKYGLDRTFKVIVDLATVKFLSSYGTKPAYVFAAAGLPLLAGGLLAAAGFVLQFVTGRIWIQPTTILLLSVFLALLGALFCGLGLLAEMVVRTHHEAIGRSPFVVRERLGFPPGPSRSPEQG